MRSSSPPTREEVDADVFDGQNSGRAGNGPAHITDDDHVSGNNSVAAEHLPKNALECDGDLAELYKLKLQQAVEYIRSLSAQIADLSHRSSEQDAYIADLETQIASHTVTGGHSVAVMDELDANTALLDLSDTGWGDENSIVNRNPSLIPEGGTDLSYS
jgi:hypothetical protein